MVYKTPSVSVIIPTHRRNQLLYDAVASVLTQQYRDFELIIVNDNGDGIIPSAVQAQIAHTDRPVSIIQTTHNKTEDTLPSSHHARPGAVRNIGARHAKGRLLAFLDDDDLWHPEKLASHVPFHHASRCLISHTREQWLRGTRTISQRTQRHARSGDIFQWAIRKCIIGPSTVLINRALFEQVGGFDENLEIAEDYELWMRICAAHRVAWLDEPLTIKREGDWPQLSRRYEQIEGFRIAALRPLIEKKYFSPPHHILAVQELARKCAIFNAGAQKRSKSHHAYV